MTDTSTPRLLDSSTPRLRLRVGVDTGGTFTDIAVLDDATGELTVGKTLTTPDDPSRAIAEGAAETVGQSRHAMQVTRVS